MTEFQAIDFQTYQAVQEAITVLENVDKTPYTVSKMGQGLGAAYAARVRELATVDVDGENGELSYEKIAAVCDQITDMVQALKWMWETQLVVADAYDYPVAGAIGVLETVIRVALDPNPDNKN
nr:MAG TPA: hypothetical protein [Caudoviricetes sp.]